MQFKRKYVVLFCQCTETRYFMDGCYVRRAVERKEICCDWEDLGFSISYFILLVTFWVWLRIKLRQMCVPEASFSILVLLLPLFFLSCWNTMVFWITTYPFARHRSPYAPAVNKMPSSCAITKTRLFKYIETFTTKKMKTFRWKILVILIFLLKK